MARYFFDIQTKDGSISDVEGIEMESLAEVYQEAEGAARQLLADAIINDKEPPIAVVVYDNHRQKVAEIEFRNLVPVSR